MTYATRILAGSIRDARYALRRFGRTPLVAATIVGTVALGLGLVTVAFTVLDGLLLRVDAVPDVHEMFAVERTGADRAAFTRTQFESLQRDTTVLPGAWAERSQVDSVIDGRLVWGTFATGRMFQVLRVPAAIGRALTPADDAPGANTAVMVLSDRGWDRLFARDPTVVGRRLVVNGYPFEIVGVMPKGFRGLTLAPDDYWAPLTTLGHVRPTDANATGLDIVGRLAPGLSIGAASAQLTAWEAGQSTSTGADRATAGLTLAPRRGTVRQPLEAVPITAPLFFAFGLILLIGCANVANLLLARGVARQREIGIQLSIGATRGRIVRQLLTESLLLGGAAALVGFAISRVVLAGIVSALVNGLPPDIGDIRLLVPDADWRVVLFLAAGAVVATLAFALGPALQATRVDPIRTLRGHAGGRARPGRARNALIGAQVAASALLLVCAAVFLRSAYTATTYRSGLRTADTVAIEIANETARDAIVRATAADPHVVVTAAAWPDLAPRDAVAESADVKARVAWKFVSPEYFGVMDVGLIRGRAFTPGERAANLAIAVVSETAARTLWPHADALGQVLHLEPETGHETARADGPPLDTRTFTVIGVAHDVPGFRIAPFPLAAVYLPADTSTPSTALVARVSGDVELARQALVTRLAAIDPDMGRRVTSLRTMAMMDTYFLRFGFGLTIALGALALALTLSGLFSVLSYVVAQRRREIGVRMALGATPGQVRTLVLAQSILPLALGVTVGTGGAAALAALILSTPAAADIGAIVRVFDPLAYVASVALIVAACGITGWIPATRAARLDPLHTLRQD